MRPQEKSEPLRFRYRAKLGQHLLGFVAALIFGALLVHAARSGLGAPSRGFARIFAFDPALLWWSAAVLVFGISLIGLRGVMNALGPGKTITLTEDNLILSGRSAADRERIPYRTIEHARCVDLSTTEAMIVIRFGRVEKEFASGLFESVPAFYAFWSGLRARLKPAVVQGSDSEGFEQHGSTQRAVESLLQGKHWVIGCCVVLVVVAAVYVVRHRSATVDRSPVAAAAPVAAPVIASSPQGVFLAESIVTRGQQADLEGLHLPLEAKSWVVNRQHQVYFVPQGGGPHDIPYLFALVLPREGITVQIEGRMRAGDVVEPGLADLDWDIISVKVPNQHAAAAPRCLELVRRALQAYGYHGDLSGIREVRVKLPSPTFT